MASNSCEQLLGALANLRPELRGKTSLTEDQMRLLKSSLNPKFAWDQDIIDQLENPSDSRKYVFYAKEPPFVFAAFFERSLNSRLEFEFFRFEEAPAKRQLRDIFKESNAFPVTLCRPWSGGLDDPTCVALFPEDWHYPELKGVEELDGPEATVFFFMCRFFERFKKYSWPALRRCTADSAFPNLKWRLRIEGYECARGFCADWMWMHEKSHRAGQLPFSFKEDRNFRLFKGGRHAAAFEEMRADVYGICEILKDKNFSARTDKLEEYRWSLAEFILFERLVRYPVQYLTREDRYKVKELNYDSVGSLLLFYFLKTHGFLSTRQGRLELKESWPKGLKKYKREATAQERKAKRLAEEASSDICNQTQDELVQETKDELTAAAETGSDTADLEEKRRRREELKEHEVRMYIGRRHLEQFVKRAALYDESLRDYPLDPFFHACAAQLKEVAANG